MAYSICPSCKCKRITVARHKILDEIKNRTISLFHRQVPKRSQREGGKKSLMSKICSDGKLKKMNSNYKGKLKWHSNTLKKVPDIKR